MEGDQSRPDGKRRPRGAGDDERPCSRAGAFAARRRRRLLDADHHRRVADRRASALRRQRRWPPERDARRRADLDIGERSDCRTASRHVRQQRAAVAARGGPRLRDVRRPLQRRLPRLRVRERRLRSDVAIDRGRASRGIGAQDPRAPAESTTAVCRPRARHSFLDRRRRQLVSAEPQHADGAGRRHPDSPARERSRGRHARPQHLDPRQHLVAGGVDAGRDAERSVPRTAGARSPPQHLQSAGLVWGWSVLRAEPRLQRRHRLLPARRIEGRGRRDGCRRTRHGSPHVQGHAAALA